MPANWSPDWSEDPPPLSERALAAMDMLRRTGATQFQLRFSDDDVPTVWMALSGYANGGYKVGAALSPDMAVLHLLEATIDGGMCMHCNRPAGLNVDETPIPDGGVVCWYEYDSERKTIRRGCE